VLNASTIQRIHASECQWIVPLAALYQKKRGTVAEWSPGFDGPSPACYTGARRRSYLARQRDTSALEDQL